MALKSLLEKERMQVTSIFFFSYDVFYLLKEKLHHMIWFLRVISRSLLKTLWEMEKLLVASSFSFSYSVFEPFVEVFAIFTKSKIVVENSLSLEESKICRLGNV